MVEKDANGGKRRAAPPRRAGGARSRRQEAPTTPEVSKPEPGREADPATLAGPPVPAEAEAVDVGERTGEEPEAMLAERVPAPPPNGRPYGGTGSEEGALERIMRAPTFRTRVIRRLVKSLFS